jgi:hypothetical protein
MKRAVVNPVILARVCTSSLLKMHVSVAADLIDKTF